MGPVTAAKMEKLGILTGADLASWPIEQLEAHFGSSGRWYWRIARGIDEREVKPDRPYRSVSAERTFDVDLAEQEDLRRELTRVAGYAWQRIERAEVEPVTLKVKFADFSLITRSKTSPYRCLTPRSKRQGGAAEYAAAVAGYSAARPGPSLDRRGGETPAQLGLAI